MNNPQAEIVLPIDIAVEWVTLTASPEEVAFLESTRYEIGTPLQRCMLPEHVLQTLGATPEEVCRVVSEIAGGPDTSHALENIDDEFA